MSETTKPKANSAFGVRRAAFCVLQNNPAVFELKCQWSIGLLQSLKYVLP